jgi:hypothetical protein
MSPLGLNGANGETLAFSTHLCAKTPGIDVMQEGRFELNLKLLGRLTHREFDKPRKITNQVSSFSGLRGQNVVSRSLVSR